MKILLINPLEENLIDTQMPEVLESGIGFSPPLGLMILAACIRKGTDWDVEIIDALAERLDYRALESRIRKAKPDAVGITVMSNVLLDCVKTAKLVKRVSKGIKVILGGPHVNIYPAETIAFGFVDFVTIGEAEYTIIDLLKNMGDSEAMRKVAGLYFKDKGEIIFTGQRDFIQDLDALPFPARDLLKKENYSSTISEKSFTTTMITSRGCPYRCVFCDRPHLGKAFRARSAENVVDEMEECVRMGIDEILIYDDTFTIDRKRVVDVCREIKRRKLKILWDIRARVNTVDLELLKMMKDAGCIRIHYGVESGNERILKVLNKGITKKQVRKAFSMTKKAGIETLGYFMIGCPEETRENIEETFRFAKELEPDYCHFAIFIPMPATQIYDEGLKRGILHGDLWQKFAKDPKKGFVPELWVEHLPKEGLVKLLKQSYSGFYLRPKYVLNNLLKVRSVGGLVKRVKAGLKVLKLA
jgi:anaerobic magnesium-protoporphyrin IX monomethyl ester cyclase